MQVKTEITTVFNTSLERAFKSPMLCDITKVHTGYGITPRVTHCTDDENWGSVGGTRKVFMAKSFISKEGDSTIDKVLERKENSYWKIEISEFTFTMLGIEKLQGEWITTQEEENRVHIRYIYTIFSKYIFLYPMHWLFTKTVWRIYMKHVMENVRQLAVNNSPYLNK